MAPSESRFCSADPVEGQADDPQSWNRYAYARDDPINLTDPNGQFFEFLLALLEGLLSGLGAALEESAPISAQLGAAAATTCPYSTCVVVTDTVAESTIALGAGLAAGTGAATAQAAGSSLAALKDAAKGLQKQKLNKPNCKKDLQALNLTADQVRQGAAQANFINGIGSNVPRVSLYATSPVPEIAKLAPLAKGTVGEYFTENPGAVAQAQLGGHDIYVNPGLIKAGAYWQNLGLVFHEVVHNITGLLDHGPGGLQDLLGLKQQNVTSNINDKLIKDCF